MNTTALLLVIAAALLHASWNLASKKAGGDARFSLLVGLIMMVVWAPVGIYFSVDEVPRWEAKHWLLLCISAITHTLYFIFLLRGYRKADLTVVYPIARGTGPLITVLVAVIFLGEALSLGAASGIAVLLIGIFLIAGGFKLVQQLQQASSGEAQARTLRGLRYGFLTGLFIAAYTVFDGYGVKYLLISPILLDYWCNILRLPLLLPAALKNRGETLQLWRAQWRYALVVAVLSPVAYVLVLYAVKIAPMSHVAPAREVSMLFAALIGGHLLKEGDRAQRILGAGLIAAGVVMLAVLG